MDIAVSLFTYNRSYHTKMVLSSLKRSTILPSKLYLFQDGLRVGDDIYEWEKVNALIQEVHWCDTEVVVSSFNRGLANSIISGINYMFREGDIDAVIILEDDCVPTTNFISYMYQCFEKYKSDKDVYTVSGYSYPIVLEKNQYDVYACGRISSWGWGTWKDRWEVFTKDYEIIRRIKQDAVASRNLAIWGRDLEETLVGNVRGICDSWAVFWALNVIERKGICIMPYKSFIRNIGMDGSGVHCGITNQFEVECIDENKEKFNLPEKINIMHMTEQAFAPFLGSYTATNCNEEKAKILVYGVGNFYLKYEDRINEEYYIEKFVDMNKKGYFEGKKIIKPKEISECYFDKILIMIQNGKEAEDIADFLMINYNISKGKIELGSKKYLSRIDNCDKSQNFK